ncbi:MAG: hypothetical protein U0798_11130 [Gemmataceae bacterium]
MMNLPEMNRRSLLKGLGAIVALPWMESLAHAAGPAGTVASQATSGPAKRAAFLYVPNGVIMTDWKSKKDGALGDLPGNPQIAGTPQVAPQHFIGTDAG